MQKIPVITGNKIVISSLKDYFVDFQQERGAALGIKDNVISCFYPITNRSDTKYSFVPDFEELNKASEYIENQGCEFIGIIHSHNSYKSSSSVNKPSKDDINFYHSFAKANPDFKYLLFPIIGLENNQKVINWYLYINGELKEINVEIA